MTVVSVLRLQARVGGAANLVRAFAELGVFERSRESGGFRGGRLLRPLEGGDGVLVIAEWDAPSDYQRWLENPVREELGAALEPLLAGEVVAGELYEEAP